MCSPFRRRQKAKYGACYPLWYRRCTLEHFCDGIPAHMSHSGSWVDCGCLFTFLLVAGVSLPHTTTDWQMRTRTMPRWLYAIWVAVLSQEPAEAQSRLGYVHTPRQQLLYLPGPHCSILWHAIAWQHCRTDLFGGCSVREACSSLTLHTACKKAHAASFCCAPKRHQTCRHLPSTTVVVQVTFLYTLTDGACPKSYGVNVARLAGLPDEVIKRASSFATQLEDQHQAQTVGMPLQQSEMQRLHSICQGITKNHINPESQL